MKKTIFKIVAIAAVGVMTAQMATAQTISGTDTFVGANEDNTNLQAGGSFSSPFNALGAWFAPSNDDLRLNVDGSGAFEANGTDGDIVTTLAGLEDGVYEIGIVYGRAFGAGDDFQFSAGFSADEVDQQQLGNDGADILGAPFAHGFTFINPFQTILGQQTVADGSDIEIFINTIAGSPPSRNTFTGVTFELVTDPIDPIDPITQTITGTDTFVGANEDNTNLQAGGSFSSPFNALGAWFAPTDGSLALNVEGSGAFEANPSDGDIVTTLAGLEDGVYEIGIVYGRPGVGGPDFAFSAGFGAGEADQQLLGIDGSDILGAPFAHGFTFINPFRTILGQQTVTNGSDIEIFINTFAGAGNTRNTFTGVTFELVSGPDPILLGDVNMDGIVNFLDIAPFIALLSSGDFQAEADVDRNDAVDFLDIGPFIQILSAP